MDEIEKIIPPKLPKGLAISIGKARAKFQRECCGVNEGFLECDPPGIELKLESFCAKPVEFIPIPDMDGQFNCQNLNNSNESINILI